MRTRYLPIPLFITICVLTWLPTRGGAESYLDQFAGEYRLMFHEDTGWHEHRLEITSITPERVSGKVTIDWNIGPESRMPEPHEKAYLVEFEAERESSSSAIAFEVAVGDFDQVTYSFQIYLMLHEKVPIAVGTVTVQLDDKKLGPVSHYVSPGTLGVFAHMISE